MLARVRTFLAATLAVFSLAQAESGGAAESPKGLVIDYNRLMSAQQVDAFTKISTELREKTGCILTAALLDNMRGIDARKDAGMFAESWLEGTGTECEASIYVAQKQRRMLVVTLGAAKQIIPEATSETFVQEVLVPAFRKEHYGEGVLVLGARLASEIARAKGTSLDIDESLFPKDEPMSIRGWIFIVAVFGLLIAFGSKGRRFGFFDNMKKLLSVSEIEKSQWPGIFRDTFGDNLVSAFISGRCLTEGFDALATPWTINFILKDNSPAEIAKLEPFQKRARRDNVEFGKFYSPAEIIRTLDTNPLEYLHIANRNYPLCGIRPLDGFTPHRDALRQQCEHELRDILEHLRGEHAKKFPGSAQESIQEIIPVLYGVFFLQTGSYPENHQQVFERFPGIGEGDTADAIETILGNIAS